MSRFKIIFISVAVVLVLAILTIQTRSIQQLRTELATVKAQLAGEFSLEPKAVERASASAPKTAVAPRNLDQRLAELEKAVANLNRASEYLMERGQLPMAETKIQEAHARFLDAGLSDRDRLRALEVLRRNGGMNDELALQALAWLQSTTNANTQRTLLQHLDGSTNAALKQPLMAFAASENSGVREQAVENLRHFVSDPQVEALLWQTLRTDPDEDVRNEAQDALGRGPFTETRVATLQQRAVDPQASLDERLLALRALNRAGADAQTVTSFLADLAHRTTDPDERLRLFRAFDGLRDPVFKLPLVYGLQDPNPLVREEAVDALSNFRSDPQVEQWLRYVAQNDTDAQVRREAFEALGTRGN